MSSFEDVLQSLRSIYLEETRRRAAEMAVLLDALQSGRDRRSGETQVALDALVIQFHGLAGTGTSYGFEELSLLGRLGEHDAGARQRLGGACTPEELHTWKALIRQIEAAACPAFLPAFPSTSPFQPGEAP